MDTLLNQSGGVVSAILISFRHLNENCCNTAVQLLLKAMRSFGKALMIRFSGLGANLPFVAQESVLIGEKTPIGTRR